MSPFWEGLIAGIEMTINIAAVAILVINLVRIRRSRKGLEQQVREFEALVSEMKADGRYVMVEGRDGHHPDGQDLARKFAEFVWRAQQREGEGE